MFTFNILLFFLIIIHSKALMTDPGTIQLQRNYDYLNTYGNFFFKINRKYSFLVI